MIQVFKKMFQRVPLNQYNRLATTLKDQISQQNRQTSQVASQEIQEYNNFNKQLYRQHIQAQQESYLKRVNRDFDKNTILKAEYQLPETYYGSSLALFLLFDWQLLIGTSTYLTMLATAGGAGALLYKSLCNSSNYGQISEIKLLPNDQLQIYVHNQQSRKVALRDFKFNVKDEQNNSFFGSGVRGYLVKAGKDFYRVNDNMRIDRSLFQKFTK